MKITKLENCGNSPKNIFLEEFAIEILKQNVEFINEHSNSDLKIMDILDDNNFNFSEVEIIYSISHGKVGTVLFEGINNGVRRLYSFHFIFATLKFNKVATFYVTSGDVLA